MLFSHNKSCLSSGEVPWTLGFLDFGFSFVVTSFIRSGARLFSHGWVVVALIRSTQLIDSVLAIKHQHSPSSDRPPPEVCAGHISCVWWWSCFCIYVNNKAQALAPRTWFCGSCPKHDTSAEKLGVMACPWIKRICELIMRNYWGPTLVLQSMT